MRRMTSPEDARAVFVDVLQRSWGGGMRDFALECYGHMSDGFFEAPASTSGRHHPPEMREPCGLVLHTLVVLRLCCDIAPLFQKDQDQVFMRGLKFAALFHDSSKGEGRGTREWTNTTNRDHGAVAHEWLQEVLRERGSTLHEQDYAAVSQALVAVRDHMVQWSLPPVPFEGSSLMTRVLSVSDYVSSRPHIQVKI